MSRQIRVLCGVPDANCSGTILRTDQVLHTKKCHMSHADAFRCMAKHLTKDLGFTRMSSREFINPENGHIRVLERQMGYGALMVQGKENRFMPEKRNAGNRGVIIG